MIADEPREKPINDDMVTRRVHASARAGGDAMV
jgi:hypothetical protein